MLLLPAAINRALQFHCGTTHPFREVAAGLWPAIAGDARALFLARTVLLPTPVRALLSERPAWAGVTFEDFALWWARYKAMHSRDVAKLVQKLFQVRRIRESSGSYNSSHVVAALCVNWCGLCCLLQL